MKHVSDIIGITSSGLCLVHCLVLPFVMVFAAYSEVSVFGLSLDYLFATVAIGAVYFAVKKAHSPTIKVVLLTGLALFVGGVVVHDLWSFDPLMHLGSATLITGHAINYARCRKGACEVKLA